MAIPKLDVLTREGKGKKSSHSLRKDGFVPGVIYGHNKDTKTIKIDGLKLEKLLNRYGDNGTVTLELDGEIKPTIIKEIQRGIVKEGVMHIDFQELSAGEKIRMTIHVSLIGKEKVETSSTIIQQQLSEIDIQCLPKDIPSGITADVSNLETGKSLTVGELDIFSNDNIEVLNDESEIVASLTTVKSEPEPDEEEDDTLSLYDNEPSTLENN